MKAYSLKSLQKFSSLRDWFSTMDEFVSKFDSQGRLVGLRFSQAAIPQQVTCDSEDCREFFASAAEQQWQLYPVFAPWTRVKVRHHFAQKVRVSPNRVARGTWMLPPIERRLYCRAHWSGHSNQRGNQGIKKSHLGSRLSGSRITSGSTEN